VNTASALAKGGKAAAKASKGLSPGAIVAIVVVVVVLVIIGICVFLYLKKQKEKKKGEKAQVREGGAVRRAGRVIWGSEERRGRKVSLTRRVFV